MLIEKMVTALMAPSCIIRSRNFADIFWPGLLIHAEVSLSIARGPYRMGTDGIERFTLNTFF